MSVNLVAIDLGFLYTKSVVNDKEFLFQSVVGTAKKLRFDDVRLTNNMERIITHVDGNDFFVGDLAIRQSDVIIHSLKPNRFDSEATKTLVNSVYALGLGNGMHEVCVVSGLPVSHYTTYKDQINLLFSGHSQFLTLANNNRISGEVKILGCKLIPQPFGLYIDFLLDSNGMVERKDVATRTVAVIDIGFGTTDVYVVNALEPIESLTFSTQTAMNHTYSLISNRIEELCDISLPLYKIESVVKSNALEVKGKRYAVDGLIKWAYEMTATQLLSEIFSKWKNTWEIDQIIIGGGGSIPLYAHIEKELQNAILVNDPQLGVVRGYTKWGRRNFSGVIQNAKR